MIKVQNLTRRFGAKTAVDGVSFEVGKGEVLGFLGPNGAGKTTTMRMITGYLAPSDGRVEIEGLDMSDAPKRAKAMIGYLPEQSPAYKDMRVAAFLDFAASVRGLSGAAKRSAVGRVVDICHLEKVYNQSVEVLSKGFLQRVCLAQALIHDPPILILDEPTDGLDPNQKHDVRSLINEMGKDRTIVISTHILEEVEACCRRVIIIADGKVKADGTPAQLMEKSSDAGTVLLGLDAGDALEALKSLPGVGSAKLESSRPGRFLYRLRASEKGGGASLAAAAAGFAKGKGWDIRDLTLDKGRLDQVFRDITTSSL